MEAEPPRPAPPSDNEIPVKNSSQIQIHPSISPEVSAGTLPSNTPAPNTRHVSGSSTAKTSDPSSSLPWASRLKSSLRNLQKTATPSYRDNGIPVVRAHASVLLKGSEKWSDYLIANFTGNPPVQAKIYSDLNPIWGKFGNISLVRKSKFSFLIYIPNRSTREWVMQVGYWQTDLCGFVVSEWTPKGTFQEHRLTSVPVWVNLSNIPLDLFTLQGLSIIASAIGDPMHTENSRLSFKQLGEAKVKIEIQVDSITPDIIEVEDDVGDSVFITASYPRLPPKCEDCNEFGHSISRCPKQNVNSKTDLVFNSAGKGIGVAPSPIDVVSTSDHTDNTPLRQSNITSCNNKLVPEQAVISPLLVLNPKENCVGDPFYPLVVVSPAEISPQSPVLPSASNKILSETVIPFQQSDNTPIQQLVNSVDNNHNAVVPTTLTWSTSLPTTHLKSTWVVKETPPPVEPVSPKQIDTKSATTEEGELIASAQKIMRNRSTSPPSISKSTSTTVPSRRKKGRPKKKKVKQKSRFTFTKFSSSASERGRSPHRPILHP